MVNTGAKFPVLEAKLCTLKTGVASFGSVGRLKKNTDSLYFMATDPSGKRNIQGEGGRQRRQYTVPRARVRL